MGRILNHFLPVALLLVFKESHAQQLQTITICEARGPGTIACPLGKEIKIVTILYGRTNALPDSTCNPYRTPITNYNCVGGPQADNYVNTQCSGQSKCTLTNSYRLLGDPCPGAPKFLKVDYQCIIPTLPPPNTSPTPTTPPVVASSTSQFQITICEIKSHTVNCPVGKVLWITHVLWGRLSSSPPMLCNPYQNVVTGANCKSGPTPTTYVESLCNGKRTCTVANDWTKLGPDPCTGIPKYLQVRYTCVIPTNNFVTTLTPTTTSSPPTASTPTTPSSPAALQPTLPQTILTPGNSQAQITICESKSHTFNCPVGKVLWITHVLWGRLPSSPTTLCNPFATEVTGANCKGGPTATKYVESLCNGKPSCTVANDWTKLGPDPCNEIPKYLQVSFTCAILSIVG